MAPERKGKMAEIGARLKGREELLAEEPSKELCCNIHTRYECEKCPARFCEDHVEIITHIRGKFLCRRCLSELVLFEDLRSPRNA